MAQVDSLKSIEKRARTLYVEWSDLHAALSGVKGVRGAPRTWLTLYDVVADARATLEIFKDQIVERSEDPDGIDQHVDQARGRAYKKIEKVNEFLSEMDDTFEHIDIDWGKYRNTQGFLRALEGAVNDFYALLNKLRARIDHI
jgi:hypothetical protein